MTEGFDYDDSVKIKVKSSRAIKTVNMRIT